MAAAADLLIMDAVDECGGQELGDDRWLVLLSRVGASVLLNNIESDEYLQDSSGDRGRRGVAAGVDRPPGLRQPGARRRAVRRHHGYEITERSEVSDSAWKNGGGAEYTATLKRALNYAHAGKFSVLIVWRWTGWCARAPRTHSGSSASSASAAASWRR